MKNRTVVTALVGLLLLSPAALRASGPIAVLAQDSTTLNDEAAYELVVTTVIAYADDMLPKDELVEFSGVWVKKSNYQGIALGAKTYYYCLAPHFCSCPVCRGVLDPTAVDRLYSDGSTDFPLIVYTPHYDNWFLEPIGTAHHSQALDQ